MSIPIDGLALYAEQVFNTIREERDLNLQEQKRIVSEHRCREIKEQVFIQISERMNEF